MGKLGVSEDWEFIRSIDVQATKAANDDDNTTAFAHGLNFIPVVLGMVGYDSNQFWRPTPVILVQDSGSDEGLCYESISVYSDIENIYVEIITPDVSGSRYSSAITVDLKLFIFRFKATTD